MNKSTSRGPFSRVHAAEVLNCYRRSRDLAEIEKGKTEKLLQETDPQADEKAYRKASDRLEFYSRYPLYLRQNAFLMLFSLVEELLASAFVTRTGKDVESDGSGIAQFTRPYADAGITLTSVKRWEFLTKCQTVRNALLHANANITLCNNADVLHEILSDNKWSRFFEKRKGLFKSSKQGQDRHEHLHVTEAGLNELLLAFCDLEELLLGAKAK